MLVNKFVKKFEGLLFSLMDDPDDTKNNDTSKKNDYLMKGIELVQKAIEFDQQENYEEAFKQYMSSFSWFELSLKYEGNFETRNRVQAKMLEYIDRAEELKKVLARQTQKKKKEEAVAKNDCQCYTPDIPAVTFDDVSGMTSLKKELEALLIPMKFPNLKLGALSPPTVLLYGAPGN